MASDRKILSNAQSTFRELKSFGLNQPFPKVKLEIEIVLVSKEEPQNNRAR